jgi:hypothetical protein
VSALLRDAASWCDIRLLLLLLLLLLLRLWCCCAVFRLSMTASALLLTLLASVTISCCFCVCCCCVCCCCVCCCCLLCCYAVFQAERDSERFALYARKAALDARATEIRAQLRVRTYLDHHKFIISTACQAFNVFAELL